MSICDSCNDLNFSESMKTQPLEYNAASGLVVLQATVPVISCNKCGMEFTDERAEVIREKIVKEYLNNESSKQTLTEKK